MGDNRFMSFGGDVRCIGEWRFEDGGFVNILVGGQVLTEIAIEWVEKLLEIKKQELEALKATSQHPVNPEHCEDAMAEITDEMVQAAMYAYTNLHPYHRELSRAALRSALQVALATKIESDAKVIAALREALQEGVTALNRHLSHSLSVAESYAVLQCAREIMKDAVK
jgi:hypothetical protein